MVRPASVQLAATNIRVNCMSPGFVRTSIIATSASTISGQAFDMEMDKADAISLFETVLGRHSGENLYYNRIPEPVEIANVGVFLASGLAASINGQNIVVDSGKTAAAFGDTIIGPIKRMEPL